jgi:diguanylate cyclase (GGDEF)-like protein
MTSRSIFRSLCDKVGASIKEDMSQQEFGWLLRPRGHITLLSMRRIAIIVTRARLFAMLFAVLTPLWTVIDVLTFPAEVAHSLVVARALATAGFVFVLIRYRRRDSLADAYKALGLIMAIPAAFFFFTYAHMARFELQGLQQAFAIGYAFLPFVMVAGLSVFPLTLAESAFFAVPIVFVQAVAAATMGPSVGWPAVAAILWLLLLITAVSALSGLSQLAFMIVLVRDAIRDRMTGCFSRSSGEELLELQYILSSRIKTPLAVALIDVDHFKQVNDRFGHEAGDLVLADVATQMRAHLRTGDMLIRWGGEEFVLVMPNVNAEQARCALTRVRQSGLGTRPDGAPITVSVGLAERLADASDNWRRLVERADARMYEAKQAGRDRIVGCDSFAAHASGDAAKLRTPLAASYPSHICS